MQDSQWLTALAEEVRWTISYKETLPNVLVSEWQHLERQAKDGKVYGVLMNCRDLLEGIMKVPVVMSLAILDVCDDKKDEPAYAEIMRDTLADSLSMGQWQKIARMIVKKQKRLHLPENLIHILRCTLNLYDQKLPGGKEIVTWRNDTIGHGSLRFEADEEYQREIHEILYLLQDYFDGDKEWSVNDGYMNLAFQCGEVSLTGDYFTYIDKDTPIQLLADGQKYPVHHFAINYDQRCMLFDSYYPYKSTTKYSCYIDGRNLLEKIHYFSDLYDRYVRTNNGEKGLASQNITENDDRILAQLDMPSDYVKPVQLMDTLRKTLTEMDKGVVMIQMERGTGKSALAGRLNGLYYDNDEQLLKKSFVRCYHVSSANLRGAVDFVNILNDDFRASNKSGERLKSGAMELKQLSWGTTTPAKDFADFLNFYSERYFPENYTVFVLDGIDEMTERTEHILDFIPSSDDLDDDVFVLLLSRFEGEKTVMGTARHSILRAKSLADRVIAVDRKSDINRAVLKDYVKKYAPGTDATKLAEKADWRMLYLKANLQISERTELNTSDETQFIASYLNYLLSLYGAARQQEIKEILVAAALFHSISMSQFVDYLDWPEITYGKIGMMNDLMPLFTVMHRNGANFYELADEAYIDYVLRTFDTAVSEVLKMFGDRVTGIEKEYFPEFYEKARNGSDNQHSAGLKNLEEEILFCSNGLASLGTLTEKNGQIFEYCWSEPHLFDLQIILRAGIHDKSFTEAYEVTAAIEVAQNSLLEFCLTALKNGDNPAMQKWLAQLNAQMNDKTVLSFEEPYNRVELPFKLVKQPEFNHLKQYIIDNLYRINQPKELFWLLIMCRPAADVIACLNKYGLIDDFSRYYSSMGELFYDIWEDFGEMDMVADSYEPEIKPTQKGDKYSYPEDILNADIIKDLAETLNSNPCEYTKVSELLNRYFSGKEMFGEEKAETFGTENFAAIFFDRLQKMEDLGYPEKALPLLNALQGNAVAMYRSQYGMEEEQWLPPLDGLCNRLTADWKTNGLKRFCAAAWMKFEVICFYSKNGETARELTRLEDFIQKYDTLWHYNSYFDNEGNIKPQEKMGCWILPSDNILFFLNLLLKTSQEEKGRQLIARVEKDTNDFYNRLLLPENTEFAVSIEDFEYQIARFQQIRTMYGYDDDYLNEYHDIDNRNLKNVSEFMERLSEKSDIAMLKKMIGKCLENEIQSGNWDRLHDLCDNCERILCSADNRIDRELKDILKPLKNALEVFRGISCQLAAIDRFNDAFRDYSGMFTQGQIEQRQVNSYEIICKLLGDKVPGEDNSWNSFESAMYYAVRDRLIIRLRSYC